MITKKNMAHRYMRTKTDMKIMDEMNRIVICCHCGSPEYYGEMRWLSGWCGCRSCYKQRYEEINRKPYIWDDLNGYIPTMKDFNEQYGILI